MVVEARLADRYHLGMAGASDERVGIDVEFLMGMMRMRAHRAVHVRKTFGDREHLIMPLDPGRDRDHAGDAGRLGAGYDRVELGRKVGKIEVAVAVDQHGSGWSMPHVGCARRAGIFLLEVRDLAREILHHALAQRGVRAVGHLGDHLGQRRDDLVHVHGVFLAVRRAIFCIEIVDQVGDQAMQARPLFFFCSGVFRGVVRHGPSSLSRAASSACSALYKYQLCALPSLST